MDNRVSARVDEEIKAKAIEQLKSHGMTLSELIRSVVTTVAFHGLPSDWGLPNKEVLASLDEVIDDINNPHLQRTSNRKELEKLLDE